MLKKNASFLTIMLFSACVLGMPTAALAQDNDLNTLHVVDQNYNENTIPYHRTLKADLDRTGKDKIELNKVDRVILKDPQTRKTYDEIKPVPTRKKPVHTPPQQQTHAPPSHDAVMEESMPEAMPPAPEPMSNTEIQEEKPIKTLRDELDKARMEAGQKATVAKIKDGASSENPWDELIVWLEKERAVEKARGVGQKAKDFILPNAQGEDISLSHLLEQGPAVLVWYRGGWCPYCNMHMRKMNDILPELKSQGAQLVAISPESPDNAEGTQVDLALTYPVLSDIGNHVARTYGLVYPVNSTVDQWMKEKGVDIAAINNSTTPELPLAATYVVDTDGTIVYAFVDEDYKERAEPADVLKALDALNNKTASKALPPTHTHEEPVLLGKVSNTEDLPPPLIHEDRQVGLVESAIEPQAGDKVEETDVVPSPPPGDAINPDLFPSIH